MIDILIVITIGCGLYLLDRRLEQRSIEKLQKQIRGTDHAV